MTLERKQDDFRNQPYFRALTLQNVRRARRNWEITAEQLGVLKTLTEEFQFSVALGDLNLLDNKWYVTHSGLLRLARRNRCVGIHVRPMREFCDPAQGRWVFRATVHKSSRSRLFAGYGDADPTNVSPLVRGAEMRVAETRAVSRALRKAYGVGLCSVEELKWLSGSPEPAVDRGRQNQPGGPNRSNNGHPRLRDRLCLLIRQYNLDPTLVKQYAAEFCGTPTLKEATRESVESFITHLGEWAKRNKDELLCKLNSFSQPVETKP